MPTKRLRKPDAPLDPANRRISLIVQYVLKSGDDDDTKSTPENEKNEKKDEGEKPSPAEKKPPDKE